LVGYGEVGRVEDVGSGLSVAVVDERPLIRQGLLRVLQATAGVALVRALTDVPEPDDTDRYDVLVMGIHSCDSLTMLQKIHHLTERCRLLVLSDSLILLAALVLLDAGADGYLTTAASEQALREAVRCVGNGRPYLAKPIIELIRDSRPERRPYLAPREAEVLYHIAAGRTHAQAAHQMGLSVATVETYLRRIRKKFAINAPTCLARLARRVYVQRLMEQHGT